MTSIRAALLALAVVTLPQSAPCQVPTTPVPGPLSKHSFDLTIHYHYSVMEFISPHSPEEFLRDPKTAGQPERVLGELSAALKDNKYDAWLSKWDALSQQHLVADMSASGTTQAQYLADRGRKFEQAQVIKVASRAPYVFFILHSGPHGDFAVAFKPSDKGWAATTEVDWEAQELASPNH